VFCRASRLEAQALKKILQVYEEASGQQVNLAKSGVSFSTNIPPADRTSICNALGIPEVRDHGFYLGMPATTSRNRTQDFSFVSEKVQKRVNGWREATLSQAGRDVTELPLAGMELALADEELTRELDGYYTRIETKCLTHW